MTASICILGMTERGVIRFMVHNDTPAWIKTEPRTRYFVMADGHIIRDKAGCFRMFKTRVQAERLAAKLNHATTRTRQT